MSDLLDLAEVRLWLETDVLGGLSESLFLTQSLNAQ